MDSGGSLATGSTTPAGLARELYAICEQFGQCTSRASEAAAATEASSFWAQLSSEFSTHSLQALLQAAPATNAGAVKETLWRRALESWIAAQLRGQWQPNQDGVDPGTSVAGPQLSTSTMPSAPPVADGNPAYAAAMTQLLQSQGYQGMYPPMVFPGMLGAGFGGAPASEAGASQANGSAFPAPFPVNPFTNPFQFPPTMFYGQPLASPGAHTPRANGLTSNVPQVNTPSSFGDLDMDPGWQSNLLDFSSQYGTGNRLSTSTSLPRLVTTDLSPSPGATLNPASAFPTSPTINISRSPTPEPSADSLHTRSRSLSSSGPSSPNGGKVGHHRRLSSGGSSPRFHPFPTTPKADTSPMLLPDPNPNPTLSPSTAAMSDLSLSPNALSPNAFTNNSSSSSSNGLGPPSPAPSASSATSHRRSRSSEPKARAMRSIAYDETAIFLKNVQHVFVVHTQTRIKTEVTEQDVLEIDLEENPLVNPPSTNLVQAVHMGMEYTPEMLIQDCAMGAVYSFVSTRAGATTHWTVSFDFDPNVTTSTRGGGGGEPKPRTRIEPNENGQATLLHSPVPNPVYTFCHFGPGSMTVSPTYVVGSARWWRIQECEGRHENCPGNGSWTARWDEEGEERRPSRIVQHYSSCALKKKEGDYFTLGKLARAVRATRKDVGSNGR